MTYRIFCYRCFADMNSSYYDTLEPFLWGMHLKRVMCGMAFAFRCVSCQ